MFARALPGALSRNRWASALINRNGPLARPTSPSGTALAENSSKIATGSGLDHSPSVHALYQPTDPEVARRTSAIQLARRTLALGRRVRKPSRRCSPPGSVTSSPPATSRRSISSSTFEIAGAARRASAPPPVAKRRSARTRCSPRVPMPPELWIHSAIVETDEEVRARRATGLEEALVGQISAAVLDVYHRHARPEQEGADMFVALCRSGQARFVEVQRSDPRAQPRSVEAVERIV